MTDKKTNMKNTVRFDIYSVGKFVIAALIVIYVAGLFIFTSGSTKSFEEVAGPVDGMINKRRMVKAEDRDIKKLYGINAGDYEGVLCYVAKNNLSAEEVIVVKVKETNQIKDVKDAIYHRIDKRKEDFKGYAPEEEKYLDDAIVSIRGKFVFMAVGPDGEQQKDTFDNKL